MAFVNVTGVFTDAGDLKPFSAWTEAQQAALAGFDVVIKNAKGGGKTYTVHRIKMADKLKALELGAKILKMLIAKPRPFDLPARAQALTFPDAQHGYVVGQNAMVYRYRIVPIDYTRQGMIAAMAP